MNAPSPSIDSPGSPSQVLEQLESAARRGKLPGFVRSPSAGSETRFEIADFGTPFESRLAAKVTPAGAGSLIQFSTPRLKPLLPWVFGVVLILTIWPGAWLTDSMIRSYWDWYSSRPWWITYAWYLPLTVPFCPMAMHSALRKSRTSAAAEVADLVGRVAEATGGAVRSLAA